MFNLFIFTTSAKGAFESSITLDLNDKWKSKHKKFNIKKTDIDEHIHSSVIPSHTCNNVLDVWQ